MKWITTLLVQVGSRELGFGDFTTLAQVTHSKQTGGDWYWTAKHRDREVSGQAEKKQRAKAEAVASARRLVDEWELAGRPIWGGR